MNIALLLRGLSSGNGVTRVVLAHAAEFSRLGHETHIYASRLQLTAEETDALPPRVHLHRYPCLTGSARIWSIPFGALLPYLKGGHDIVVSHLLTVWQDVIVMHNDPQPVEVEKLSAAPFTLLKPRLNSFNRRLRTFIERRRFEPGRFRKVAAVSRRSAGEIYGAFGLPDGAVRVIRHGVDAARFSPEARRSRRGAARLRLDLQSSETTFLYIGDSWKGLEFAIEGLAAAMPAGAALVAAGPFKQDKFLGLARARGLRLICPSGQWDARDLYAAADAFLGPTPLDTFNLSCLEAMAMGVPSAISEYAGVSELLTDGADALVMPGPCGPRSAAAAAAALASPELRARLGGAGAALAAGLTWEKPAAEHLALYAECARPGAAFPR